MAMLENPERPIACGVLVDNGYYTFVVERYFQGFVVASARLHIWAPVTLVSICTLPLVPLSKKTSNFICLRKPKRRAGRLPNAERFP
jgi:hypothetical protein